MSIKIKNLTLENKKVILENTSLVLEEGKIYYLTGIMGVGKTSFLNYLAKKFNVYPEASKTKCTYIESERFLFDKLTVKSNLLFYKSLYKTDDHDYNNLINYFGMMDKLSTVVSELSTGNKQLLYIVCSLMNTKAKLILLDEPFVNLDKKTKVTFLDFLEQISKSRIIIFTSHDFQNETRVYNNIKLENRQLVCYQ